MLMPSGSWRASGGRWPAWRPQDDRVDPEKAGASWRKLLVDFAMRHVDFGIG